jgi:hypothetical protein
MVDSTTNLLMIGMSSNQVAVLLGPPSRAVYQSRVGPVEQLYFLGSYSNFPWSRLGFETLPEFSIDKWYLRVVLSNGVVESFSITRT